MVPSFITTKTEPNLEPTDFSSSSIQTLSIRKTLALTSPPPIRSPLESLPPNLADERRRLRHFLSSLRRTHPNPNPNPNPNRNPNAKRKKPNPRSSDLQRVTAIPSAADAALIRDAVRRTRILYESIRTRLLHDEGASPLPAGRRSRSDLTAATVMRDSDLWLNRHNRTVGFIPGVHIGDVFLYRMELCVLGLHGQVQAGIDFVTAAQSQNGEPIATSIIVSGGYEDDEDRGDVLVYTGHGGREGKNEVRHSLDQKLKGGNLALERSYQYGIEIRVIRGLNCERSPTSRVYVYDGLYRVVQWWSETGKSGFAVYKFRLMRLEGQGKMGSVVFKLAGDLKKGGRRPNGYLSEDISKGKEKEPVAVFNDIDGCSDPLVFDYLVRPTFRSYVVKELGGSGCSCISSCSVGCRCIERNGGELVYDQNRRLLRGRPLVYECGRGCGCPQSCLNRVSQKGLRHRLEVFRSRETGWGVRSLDLIQAGEFVCEFSGILLTKEEVELVAESGASLVYPSKFPRRWEEWGDLSKVKPDYRKPVFPQVPDLGYAIDVSRARNVACYLSHSSNPNVFIQFVLFHHYNVEYPRLMIFALENIPPMRELSLDYGDV